MTNAERCAKWRVNHPHYRAPKVLVAMEERRRRMREAINSPEKRCCTCKKVKPRDEFAVNRGRKDGRQEECKSCNSTRQERGVSSNKGNSATHAAA